MIRSISCCKAPATAACSRLRSLRAGRLSIGAVAHTYGARQQSTRVAVLYQAIKPPVINGVHKPMKPGGYRDSGADIAYNLGHQPRVEVITPVSSPDPADDSRWCFPDTEEGILSALTQGATHLWANTIMFASHPLQHSQQIRQYQDKVQVVGQPPCMVELYDDKQFVNDSLRKHGSVTMPRALLFHQSELGHLESHLSKAGLGFPIVGKPVRGRGSHGVRVCQNLEQLRDHAAKLFDESPAIILEQFLAGEEATVTVMPPSSDHPDYWAMPIVTRFNHIDGIAPYNGVIAVVSNSRAVKKHEYEQDPTYGQVASECEAAAKFLRLTAPIRIDVRRMQDDPGSRFALFDVNMKPNMTGPGRPGRDKQASLTAIAAAELGWGYSRLLSEMLSSSFSLRHLRHLKPEDV